MVTITPLTRAQMYEACKDLPIEEAAAHMARALMPGRTYAVCRDGQLLGCGGVTARPDEPLPNVGEAWVLFTDAGRRYPKTSYRAVRWLLQEAIEAMGLEHIQALVTHEFVEGQRLAEHMGLTLQWTGYQEGRGGQLFDFYSGVPRQASGQAHTTD